MTLIVLPTDQIFENSQDLTIIGKWLCPDLKRHDVDNIKSAVLDYHWNDREKLFEDSIKINFFVNELLRDISIQLNQTLNLNRSASYWNIILGEWLHLFCQTIFDRFEVLKSTKKDFDLIGIYELPTEVNKIPRTTSDFNQKATECHNWNANLFSEILEAFCASDWQLMRTDREFEIGKPKNSHNKKKSVSMLKKMYRSIYLLFTKPEKSTVLTMMYLNKINLFKLSIKLRGIPFLNEPKLDAESRSNKTKEFFLTESDEKSFLTVAKRLAPLYLPAVYLEEFFQHEKQSHEEYSNHFPKTILTANSHYSDESWKKWAATSYLKGAKINILQHGGHYGTSKFSLSQNYEVSIANKFITWGWTVEGDNRFLPAPANKLMQRVKRVKQENILFVTFEGPMYSNWVISAPVGPQILNSLTESLNFVSLLTDSARSRLRVRPYPFNYGLNQTEEFLNLVPQDKISGPENTFISELRNVRLVVCNYNSTTFIECLSNNIPTLMYLDLNLWEIHPNFEGLYNRMIESRIVHNSEVSCALFINENYRTIEKWWTSPDVQNIRQDILNKIGYVGKKPVSELARIIQSC
jgi:putative transferase (TIGR04331 family)